MKLISMTAFVLDQQRFKEDSDTAIFKVTNYANFLSQPLTIGMFVPTDLEGNVLGEPNPNKFTMDNVQSFDIFREQTCYYKQAKSRVLFEGLRPRNGTYEFSDFIDVGGGYYITHRKEKGELRLENGKILKTVEDLINDDFDLTLTDNAKKEIGL